MDFITIKDELSYLKQKQKIEWEIESLLFNKDYLKIEPSFFEDYDDFTSSNTRVKKESMVKVLNGYNYISILRPDITTSIIKSFIPRWEKDLKLKLFYNSTVFKNTSNSNINENKHIGVEYLGDFKKDIEIIVLALDILKKYNYNFILELGTSNYINGFIDELNIDKELKVKIKNLIYKKNKYELEKLTSKLELNKDIKNLLDNILNLHGDLDSVIKKSKKYYTNDVMKKSLNELEVIKDYLDENSYLDNVHFDLSMVPELDYYAGIIFKGYYKDVYKPILSGGRYDALTEMFGMKIPAIGFSISFNDFIKSIIKRGD